jgi:hypothetical protein
MGKINLATAINKTLRSIYRSSKLKSLISFFGVMLIAIKNSFVIQYFSIAVTPVKIMTFFV